MKLTKVTHDNTIEDNYGFDTLPSVLVVSDIDQAEAFYSQLLGMPGLSPTAYFQAPAETSGEVCPDDGDWGVRDSENTSNLFSKKIVGTLLPPPLFSIPKYRPLLVVQSPLFYNHGKFQ